MMCFVPLKELRKGEIFTIADHMEYGEFIVEQEELLQAKKVFLRTKFGNLLVSPETEVIVNRDELIYVHGYTKE